MSHEFCIARMTERQRLRNNRLCKEEAVSRGKTEFKGVCPEHGLTTYVIGSNGADRGFDHKCRLCKNATKTRFAMRNYVKDKDNHARKQRNRKKLFAAMRAGKLEVKLECQYHGLTMFWISASCKRSYCRKCRAEQSARRRSLTKPSPELDAPDETLVNP